MRWGGKANLGTTELLGACSLNTFCHLDLHIQGGKKKLTALNDRKTVMIVNLITDIIQQYGIFVKNELTSRDVLSFQSYRTLSLPMGFSQARIPECVAISFSRVNQQAQSMLYAHFLSCYLVSFLFQELMQEVSLLHLVVFSHWTLLGCDSFSDFPCLLTSQFSGVQVFCRISLNCNCSDTFLMIRLGSWVFERAQKESVILIPSY